MTITNTIAGPIPANPFALKLDKERTRRIENVRRTFGQSLDPKIRKTRSFFPCLDPLLNRIRFRLGLSFRPASPLDKTERTNLAIYNRFKDFEGSMRKGVFFLNLQHFASIDLSPAKAESLHRKFNAELDNSLAKSFARELRSIRDQSTEIDFPEAICQAYTSIYLSVTEKLMPDRRGYPDGYIYTAMGQLEEIVKQLKSAITPQMTSSESTPELSPC